MQLKQPLVNIINDLMTQEKNFIQKYEDSASKAKDPVLKELFEALKNGEQKHLNSLSKLLSGVCEQVDLNNSPARGYCPKATYVGNYNKEDKTYDEFLCTDNITYEKYTASAYNFNLFQFPDLEVRKLLQDIETEEQDHAFMIYKYKEANQMVQS